MTLIDITVKESCTNGQGLRPNPSDCSGYQMCNHGQWVSMSCADGLYWNAELAICDWPANVRCALPESSQPAPQPSSTTAAPEPSVVTSAAPTSPEPSTTSAAPAAPSTTLAPETAATPSPPSSSGIHLNYIHIFLSISFLKLFDFLTQVRPK